MSDWDIMRRFGSSMSSGGSWGRVSEFVIVLESKLEFALEKGEEAAVGIEGGGTNPPCGARSDWFTGTKGAAGSALPIADIGVGVGTASGLKVGRAVTVVVPMLGEAPRPPKVGRETTLAGNELSEGSTLSCNGPATAQSGKWSFSGGVV
jgi:hypothetical protein